MKHAFSNPDEYKEHSSLQYDFAHTLIKDANIKATDRILDVGCGDGKITADMALLANQGMAIGTDLSADMIQAATREYSNKIKNLGFMAMDAENNIFSKQFDIVTSFCCLHWVKDQLGALNGIKNALVENGKAILLVPLRHEELYTAIESIVSNQRWKDYFSGFINPHNFFTLDIYSKLLEESGLEMKSLQKEVMSYEFKTKRSMELFLKAWLPHMNRIPESQHDEFLSDIGDKFTHIIPPNNDILIMPLTMLKVFAVRPEISKKNIYNISEYQNIMLLGKQKKCSTIAASEEKQEHYHKP